MKYHLNKFISALIVLTSFSGLAQELENTNWIFGNNTGLFHNGIDLNEITSEADVLNGVKPASISNESGALAFYTDGETVWNGDHNIIDNGQFSNLGLTNLFVPVPGNPNQLYLFRSAEWGVDYSLIDLTLNGGDGGIVADVKEVVFHDYRSELMLAGKENSVNFWLIVANNQGGSGGQIFIHTWEVTPSDFVFNATFNDSFIFATWNSELDDARLSPDCSKIATHHKGHYITLFEFDNQSGTVVDALDQSVDANTNFTIRTTLEFSPSSEYLYVIGDFTRIDRFDLTVFNATAIDGSQTMIAQSSNWRDIKLGPYGDLYLINANANTIDRVIDPDVTGEGTGVESGILEMELANFLFPNTPNLSCSSFSQPALNVQNFCLGDSTEMSFQFSTDVEEIIWDIGSDNAISSDLNSNPIWVIYDEPGTYDVSLDLYYFDLWHTFNFTVTISEHPNVELGEDIVLCEGENAVLSVQAQETYEYLWSNGSNGPTAIVSEEGNYSVVVDNQGCIGEDSVYVEVIPEIPLQLEDIAQCDSDEPVNLSAENTATDSYTWNTGADGPEIVVTESGMYWVQMSNACFTVTDSADVQLVVFPEALLPDDLSLCENESVDITVDYTEGDITWSTGSTEPTITISEPGTYSVEIDHVGCIATDEIQVEYTGAVSADIGDQVLCENEFTQYDVTHPDATSYLWSTGSTSPNITIEEGGTYWVEVSNSCFTEVDTAIVQQIIFPDPLLNDVGNACFGDSIILSPNYNFGTVVWNTGENTPQIIITESGEYTVFIDHLGCTAAATAEIEFQQYYPVDELEVPNVFTPNGDASNREFRPYAPENPGWQLCQTAWLDANVTIYNRWGVEIHKDICAWDGNSPAGEMMHEGTYFYLVDLRVRCFGRDENRQIAGHVSLLR